VRWQRQLVDDGLGVALGLFSEGFRELAESNGGIESTLESMWRSGGASVGILEVWRVASRCTASNGEPALQSH